MNWITEIIINPLFYTPLIGIVGAILGSWLTYIFALRRFHREQQYQNKLDRYLILVEKMRGFVQANKEEIGSSEDRVEFVNSYRTIWLYGSAKVVKYVSQFLSIALNPPDTQAKRDQASDKAKDILKKSIVAMRKDLKAKGKLKDTDFEIFV